MQIRSRELQQDNTEKLDNLIPIVETINDTDFSKIESDTSEIKEIVIQNLEEQTNLDDIVESLNKVSNNISNLKGSVTKLSKKLESMNKILEEVNENG